MVRRSPHGHGHDSIGILNTAGIGSAALGTSGGAITWPFVLSLVETIELGNVMDDACTFLGKGGIGPALLSI
jgi:hypothetical protein